MTLCSELALVKNCDEAVFARCLRCRSWGCDSCAEMRRSLLMAQAHAGAPNRFMTLTVNPSVGESPTDRRRLLSLAFANLVKRIRRLKPKVEFEYLAACEETKAGEPHLHVLVRSPYLPQSWISDQMRDLLDSPIVDIRAINSAKKAVQYVAKYITKAPAQFAAFKRYWMSRNWLPEGWADWEPDTPTAVKWRVVGRSLGELLAIASRAAVPWRKWSKETYVLYPTGSFEPFLEGP